MKELQLNQLVIVNPCSCLIGTGESCFDSREFIAEVIAITSNPRIPDVCKIVTLKSPNNNTTMEVEISMNALQVVDDLEGGRYGFTYLGVLWPDRTRTIQLGTFPIERVEE